MCFEGLAESKAPVEDVQTFSISNLSKHNPRNEKGHNQDNEGQHPRLAAQEIKSHDIELDAQSHIVA